MKITAAVTRSLGILLVVFGYGISMVSAADLQRPLTLVASPSLAGSDFRETVLVAAPLPNGMHVGFIVNRPSGVKLAAVFPEHPPSRKVVDPVYVGGPMVPEMVFAVVPEAPKDTDNVLQLMPGVMLVLDAEAIDRIIETAPNDARYFAGLIVWQPGELDEEVRAGAWEVNAADPSAVFSKNPQMLWKTLSHGGVRLEVRSYADRPRG